MTYKIIEQGKCKVLNFGVDHSIVQNDFKVQIHNNPDNLTEEEKSDLVLRITDDLKSKVEELLNIER